MNVRAWFVWAFLVWHAVVGLWPYSDPGHDMDSLLSRFDVGVHVCAFAALLILAYTKFRDTYEVKVEWYDEPRSPHDAIDVESRDDDS